MKTESLINFPHLLKGVCRKLREKGWKFILAWTILVGCYWLFDYVLMVKMTKMFRYLMIVPLYPAIFLSCWGGLHVYDFFHEDVFFLEKIGAWIDGSSKFEFAQKFKDLARKNQTSLFFGISIWYSPLHAYLYVRGKERDTTGKTLKLLAQGSLACAIFWGALISLILLIWNYVDILDVFVFISAFLITRWLIGLIKKSDGYDGKEAT